MARRKARIPQGKKIQPAVQTMTFALPGNGDYTLSLSQCASLVNRRFYRAGLDWAVAGFTVFTSEGVTGAFEINKIPTTWVSSNAWEKGFRSWMKMNNEALDEAESVKPKFLDFKVFMDSVHHSDGVGANLIPIDASSNQFTTGEWQYSEIVVPLTTTPGSSSAFEIIWTGANYPGAGASGNDAVSLIEGYAASRGLPDIEDPNAPTDAADAAGATPENWLSGMFNDGTTQDSAVITDMITENNKAPYPFEGDGVNVDTMYPGGANQAPGLEVHDIGFVTSTTVGGQTYLRGGQFYGGLIRFTNSMSDPEASTVVQVHLVPGEHRGYMARSMQDV